MVTQNQAMARRSGSWTFGVRIESLGTVDGLYTFHAGDAPEYAADDPLWLPLLSKLPDTLSGRVSPRGGLRDAGSLPFELFDRDDFLTGLFRWEAPARTQLWSPCNAATDTLRVYSLSGVFAGVVLYIEREAVIVTDVDASVSPPEVTVTRGALGTEPAPHEFRTPIFRYPPRLERRHVELFKVPFDADSDDERLVLDQFVIRGFDYSRDWCAYVFDSASFAMGLKRTIGDIAAGHYRVTHIAPGQTLVLARVGIDRSLWSGVDGPTGRTINPWPNEDAYYLLDEQEIIIGRGGELNGFDRVRIIQRGCLGTALVELGPEGVYANNSGPTLKPILVASKLDGISSFRRSLTGATSRADPNDWEQDTHFTTLLLCLLTSARHPDDGLELVNFPGGFPNCASLAPGWGAGMHHRKINFASFRSVRLRTPGWNYDGFIVDSPAKLFQLLQEQFMEPLGAFITLNDEQQITLVLPRAPYEGAAVTGFDESTIIAEPVGSGTYQPAISGGFDRNATVRGLLFHLRGPNGETVKLPITAADFISSSSSSKLVDGEGDDLIPVHLESVISDQNGFTGFLEEIALRMLSRLQNPPRAVPFQADLIHYPRSPGSLATLSFSAGPNHDTGTRGWVNEIVLIAERSISLSAISSGAPYGPQFTAYKYGTGRRGGLIGPTALITAWDSLTNTATIELNRYTDVDADEADALLPTADLFSLTMGSNGSDSTWLLLRQDGTTASPVGASDTRVQSIIAIIGDDQVQFDGDWEGTAAVGLIISLGDYDDAIVADQNLFVAHADREFRTVGESDRSPWVFAET